MRLLPALLVAGLALAVPVAGCDANPFDPAQQPVVTVTLAAGAPVVAWSPEGARLVRVYRGATAGDGYGPDLVWSVAAEDDANAVRSPVTVGITPPGAAVDVPLAGPLVAGATYTAEITRRDPRGRGDGFTNTANRYVGTATFTAP